MLRTLRTTWLTPTGATGLRATASADAIAMFPCLDAVLPRAPFS